MNTDQPLHWLLGRLDISALPILPAIENPTPSEFVAAGAALAVIVGAFAALAFLTWFRLWTPLWRDWLTSTDHKRIGIMYVVLAIVMMARGVIKDAMA